MTTTSTDPLSTILARDAMHGPIVAVDPSAKLREVATLMGHKRIHSVIVDGIAESRGGERLVWAVVSDRDIVAALAEGATDATAGSIAGTEALTVDADDDLAAVCERLTAHDCSHVIVVEDERPVGVVSTLDVASAFGD